MDMKPYVPRIALSYISNELYCLEIDQGMRKLHLSQGIYICGINGTFPKEK